MLVSILCLFAGVAIGIFIGTALAMNNLSESQERIVDITEDLRIIRMTGGNHE